MSDCFISLLALIRSVVERLLKKASLPGNHEFFDLGQFPWVLQLEENWKAIRNDLEKVLKRADELPNFQDISPLQNEITQDNHWKIFFFYGYGTKVQANCDRCPQTAALVESIPGMTTAFFSILNPHKHIPEHRGPYAGLLRLHLGLMIPKLKEACRIRVGQSTRTWNEGKALIFDDTYKHEVWNDTDERRAVLFVDFKRPLPWPFALLNELILKITYYTPMVQEGIANEKKWEERFY